MVRSLSEDSVSIVLTLAPGVDLESVLRDAISRASEDLAHDADIDDIFEQGVSVRWQADGGTGSLCRVVLLLNEVSADESERSAFASGMLGQLVSDTLRVETCVRFEDVRIRDANRLLADEIFYLEMRLREALTLLIISGSDDGEISGHIRESVISPQVHPNRDEMRSPHAENELFYLLFSDYANINNIPKVDVNRLMQSIAHLNDFDEFKRAAGRTVLSEDEQLRTFVARLRDLMDPIEKVRNAVAHNRVVRDRLLSSFQYAQKQLNTILEDVLNKYR